MSASDLEEKLTQPLSTQERVDTLIALTQSIGYQDVMRVKTLSEEAYALARGEADTPAYPHGLILSTISLMKCCGYFGDLDQGIVYAESIEKHINFESIDTYVLDYMLVVSSLYYNRGNYPRALEYGLRMLTMADSAPTTSRWVMTANMTAGLVYSYLEDYEPGNTYLQKALSTAKAANDPIDIAMCMLNLAEIYRAASNFDAAHPLALEGLGIFEQAGILQPQAHCHDILGQIALARGQQDEAENYLRRAQEVAQASGAVTTLMAALNALARLRMTQDQPDAAIALLSEVLTLGTSSPAAVNLIRCHDLMAKAYAQKGDYAQAYAHSQKYFEQDRALFNTKSDQRTKTLSVVHQLERSRHEAEIYRLKSEALEAEMMARNLQESQRIAEATERERSKALRRFFTNAGHDLLTPISVLRTSVYLLERITDADRQRERRAIMNTQIDRLEYKFKRMVQMAKLDSADPGTLEMESIRLDSMIDTLIRSFDNSPGRFAVQIPARLEVIADHNYLEQALRCVIENAVQYSPAESTISITASAEGGMTRISVQDAGSGISEEDRPRIFDRLYRGAQHRPEDDSSGLGLSIAQGVMRLHSGKIEVESKPGEGSRFTLVIPLTLAKPVNAQRRESDEVNIAPFGRSISSLSAV
jgi:signal transduction histidine kinase